MKVITKNTFEHVKPEDRAQPAEEFGKEKEEAPAKPVCVITAEHFDVALNTFTPSLPDSERVRYERM